MSQPCMYVPQCLWDLLVSPYSMFCYCCGWCGYLHVLCSRQSGTRYGACDFGWFESYRLSKKADDTFSGSVKIEKVEYQASMGGVGGVSSMQVARETAHLVLLRLKAGDAGVIHVLTAHMLYRCAIGQSTALNILQWSVLLPVHLSASKHACASLPSTIRRRVPASQQGEGPTAFDIGTCNARLAWLLRTRLDNAMPEVLWRALRRAAIVGALGVTDATGYEEGITSVSKWHSLGDDTRKLSLRGHESAMAGLASAVASGSVPSGVNALYSYVCGDSLAGTSLAGMRLPQETPQPPTHPHVFLGGSTACGGRCGDDVVIAGSAAGAPNVLDGGTAGGEVQGIDVDIPGSTAGAHWRGSADCIPGWHMRVMLPHAPISCAYLQGPPIIATGCRC